MESKVDLSRDGNNPNYYLCDTNRLAALTKMVLDRENIAYTKVITRHAGRICERFYTDAACDAHWLQNKVMLLEFEIEKDTTLRAQYEYLVAVRQLYQDQYTTHA